MISVAGSKKLLCIVAAVAIAILAVCAVALTLEAYGLLVELRTAVSATSRAATATIWDADKAVGDLAGAGVAAIESVRDDAHGLITASTVTVKDIHGKADKAYTILNKTNLEAAISSAETRDILRRFNREFFGEESTLRPEKKQPVVAAFREAIQAMTITLGSGDRALVGIASQVAATGEEGRKLLAHTDEAVVHVDTSLVDLAKPTIKAMENVEAGTSNVADATESFAIWMRPLRKTGGQVKAWLKLAAERFHVPIPFW